MLERSVLGLPRQFNFDERFVADNDVYSSVLLFEELRESAVHVVPGNLFRTLARQLPGNDQKVQPQAIY